MVFNTEFNTDNWEPLAWGKLGGETGEEKGKERKRLGKGEKEKGNKRKREER